MLRRATALKRICDRQRVQNAIRSHFFGVVICTVGFTAAVIVWLVSRRKKLEEDTERIINDWGIPF